VFPVHKVLHKRQRLHICLSLSTGNGFSDLHYVFFFVPNVVFHGLPYNVTKVYSYVSANRTASIFRLAECDTKERWNNSEEATCLLYTKFCDIVKIFQIIHVPCSKLFHDVYSKNFTVINIRRFLNIWQSSCMFRPTLAIFREVVIQGKSGG
jgi:hypothetical protein